LFKRLNLVNSHCNELRFATQLKLSPKLTERILTGSEGRERDNIRYFTLYGTVYTVQKTPYVVQAFVHRRKNGCLIEVRYLCEKWSKPPKKVKPVLELATALSEEPQDATFDCNAYFEYDKKSDWKSVIGLPIPIARSKKDERLFTHIEGIRLSKRERGKIQYSVRVRRTKTGNIRHLVYFAWKGPVSVNVPKRILKRSVQVSKLLLQEERDEEETHDS